MAKMCGSDASANYSRKQISKRKLAIIQSVLFGAVKLKLGM